MVRETIAVEIVIAGRRASIDQPGWYCWACKVGAHTTTDMAMADQALAELLGKRRAPRRGKVIPARRN